MKFLGCFAGATMLALSAPAGAHGYLQSSFPAAKTHLLASPREFRLRFSVRADAKYSMLVLENANGDMLKNEIQPQASRDFAMKSPALAPGRYQLRYRILSPDGDLLEGKVDFVIDDE